MTVTLTLTAEKSFAKITQSLERIDKSKPQKFPEAASVGDNFRQGDVYIRKSDWDTNTLSVVENPSLQVAPGDTQGSRHILDSLEGVTVYRHVDSGPLQGPVLVLALGRVLTHPEHGDVILPAGQYEIRYQRQHAEELKRVLD